MTERACVGCTTSYTGAKGETVTGFVKGKSPTEHSEVKSPHRKSGVVVTDNPTKTTQGTEYFHI